MSRPELCDWDRVFLPDDALRHILERTGMPVFIFDEKGLRACAESLLRDSIFSRQYVSASACPFPEILRILREEGLGVVCRNPEELQTAISCGFPGDRISYAGICVKPELADILRRIGAELLLSSSALIPEVLTDRVAILCQTPGRSAFPMPASARRPKAGLTAEEATVIASMAKRRGVKDLCLAASPDTNFTDAGASAGKAKYLIGLAEQIGAECGVQIERIHLGSGLGVEYHRARPPVAAAAELTALLRTLEASQRDYQTECCVTRRLIEPNAIFAAACLGVYGHDAQTVLIDASFEQLAIPQLDRYRHISVLGKYEARGRRTTDVIGIDPLAKDWFAWLRLLPDLEEGDCLILHDVGCCTTASAESFLVCADGSVRRLSRGSDCFAASRDAQSDPFLPSPACG